MRVWKCQFNKITEWKLEDYKMAAWKTSFEYKSNHMSRSAINQSTDSTVGRCLWMLAWKMFLNGDLQLFQSTCGVWSGSALFAYVRVQVLSTALWRHSVKNSAVIYIYIYIKKKKKKIPGFRLTLALITLVNDNHVDKILKKISAFVYYSSTVKKSISKIFAKKYHLLNQLYYLKLLKERKMDIVLHLQNNKMNMFLFESRSFLSVHRQGEMMQTK